MSNVQVNPQDLAIANRLRDTMVAAGIPFFSIADMRNGIILPNFSNTICSFAPFMMEHRGVSIPDSMQSDSKIYFAVNNWSMYPAPFQSVDSYELGDTDVEMIPMEDIQNGNKAAYLAYKSRVFNNEADVFVQLSSVFSPSDLVELARLIRRQEFMEDLFYRPLNKFFMSPGYFKQESKFGNYSRIDILYLAHHQKIPSWATHVGIANNPYQIADFERDLVFAKSIEIDGVPTFVRHPMHKEFDASKFKDLTEAQAGSYKLTCEASRLAALRTFRTFGETAYKFVTLEAFLAIGV
jgi:hypothetical protein